MNHTVLEFECVGMDNGGKFPIEYTGRGQDISPEFVIKNLSSDAKTLAITLEDISHPIKNFTHWLIWNIPAADRIKGDIPAGRIVPALGNACQGIGYGIHRYAGPKPPKGKKHTYRFTVYSLDCEMNISANSMKRNFLKKAEKHIIQKGSIVGDFEYKFPNLPYYRGAADQVFFLGRPLGRFGLSSTGFFLGLPRFLGAGLGIGFERPRASSSSNT